MKIIRIAGPADAPGVAAIYAPIVSSTAISFEVVPPTPDEMANRIVSTLRFAPWLVCADGERVEGYVYASQHNERAAYGWSVNVTAYIREDCRRMGVGRALYTALFALLRSQGFCAAHAGITLPNEASVRLHESLGFKLVGIYSRVGFKRGWYDVGWWQLELRDRTGEPPPISSVEALQRSPQYPEALAAGQALLGRG